MEMRPLLIACFVAAVTARSPFYGDPRWKCITRAPGDNSGGLEIIEKKDQCHYFCSNDNNQTWYFGLYVDTTPCKTGGKAGVCKEGDCVDSEISDLGKDKENSHRGPKQGEENAANGGSTGSPEGPKDESSGPPKDEPSLPAATPAMTPGPLEDAGDMKTENGPEATPTPGSPSETNTSGETDSSDDATPTEVSEIENEQ